MRDAMTERFENLFARLAQRREGAFVPFVNLCDPDPETSLAVLETLVASGADHASGTPAERIIRDLERAKAPPTLLGFGISTPGHVRRALEAGAAGVIVGSALVKTPRRQGRHAQGPRQRRRLLQGRHANGLKNHGPRMSIPNVFRLLKKGHPQTKTSAGALPSSQETASKRLQRGCKRCLTSNSHVTQAENTCN